jgi:hypothetical protein
MDLQVGGVSRFRIQNNAASFVANANELSYGSTIRATDFQIGSGGSRIINFNDGVFRITNNAGNDFNRLQFGGTTNAFPAIKRNGAGIDFRLADDTNFCAISATRLIVPEGGTVGVANGSRSITFDSTGATNLHTAFGGHRFSVFSSSAYVDFVTITGNTASPSVLVGTTSNVASSLFTIESTTRGFLPPRMTTTQVNAIATPAEGLVVFNTTISHLCVYQSGGWVRMSHSPM